MLSRSVVAVWAICGSLLWAEAPDVAAANPLPQTSVTVSRDDQVFTIDALTRVVAAHDVAWSVLTDYDSYVNFVPGMTLSRRIGDFPLRIEERGEFGVLFFRKAVYATLEVVETPPSHIRFHSRAGNLRRLETDVTIRSEGNQIVIRYVSVIEPDFWVPPLIGRAIVRSAIGAKLGAVAEEIQRRAHSGMSQ